MFRPHNMLPLAVAAAALALAGCSAGGQKSGDDAPKAVPATLDQLAAKSQCKLVSPTKTQEVRQAACKSPRGRLTMLTFSTDRGAKTWLEEAKPWGGAYLVGARWVIVGTPDQLKPLRLNLGGHIEHGRQHHA